MEISKMKRVAVLYICTGKYVRFFQGFYQSAKKYFLIEDAVTDYYVFTDDNNIPVYPDIHIIKRECKGFPADTLFRFEMFLTIKEHLTDYDYIYYINSNAELTKHVGTEIFPDDSGLTAVRWPKQKPCSLPVFYPYERNRKSTAYIAPFDSPYAYYMGGFYGGTQKSFYKITEVLAEAIRIDTANGIIACRNDESYLNHFLHKYPCKELPKSYCCPEEWLTDNGATKIMFRDKVILDTYFNKGRDNSYKGKIKKTFIVLWHVARWFLYI